MSAAYEISTYYSYFFGVGKQNTSLLTVRMEAGGQ